MVGKRSCLSLWSRRQTQVEDSQPERRGPPPRRQRGPGGRCQASFHLPRLCLGESESSHSRCVLWCLQVTPSTNPSVFPLTHLLTCYAGSSQSLFLMAAHQRGSSPRYLECGFTCWGCRGAWGRRVWRGPLLGRSPQWQAGESSEVPSAGVPLLAHPSPTVTQEHTVYLEQPGEHRTPDRKGCCVCYHAGNM